MENNMGIGLKKTIGVLHVWSFFAVCFVLLWGKAWAEEDRALLPRHTFQIGLGAYYSTYTEDFEDIGDQLEVDGPMYEVAGSYTYHSDIMLNASFDYSGGGLNYDGFTYPGYEPLKQDTDEKKWEARGVLGYDFQLKGDHVLTPYLGLGHRYWDSEGTGAGFYDRETTYWYSPIGLKTHSPLTSKWTWGASVEYDLFWDGSVQSKVFDIPNFNQDSGYGLRFSLRFTRPITDKYALSFEPYLVHWNVDRSDTVYVVLPGEGGEGDPVLPVWEPENTSRAYGLRVNMEF